MDCTILVAKTKVLISYAVTAQLICDFVFAHADCWYSSAVADMTRYIESMKLELLAIKAMNSKTYDNHARLCFCLHLIAS